MFFDRSYAFNIIPELTGQDNLEIFLCQCDSIYEEFGKTDCEKSLLAIIRRKVPASIWSSLRKCSDYTSIKEVLLSKFGDDTPLSILLHSVTTMSQYSSECLEEYFYRAQELFNRILLRTEVILEGSFKDSRELDPVKKIYNTLMVESFIKGINDQHFKILLLTNRVENFESILDFIKKSKLIIDFTATALPIDNCQNNDNNFTSFHRQNNNISKIKIGQITVKSSAIKCYFCRKFGHRERSCRFKKKIINYNKACKSEFDETQTNKIGFIHTKQNCFETPPDISVGDLIRKLDMKKPKFKTNFSSSNSKMAIITKGNKNLVNIDAFSTFS